MRIQTTPATQTGLSCQNGDLVRKGGFEPPRLSAPPPKDGVSASSTTSPNKNNFIFTASLQTSIRWHPRAEIFLFRAFENPRLTESARRHETSRPRFNARRCIAA